MWRVIRRLAGVVVATAVVVIAWLLLSVEHVPSYPPPPDALSPAAYRDLIAYTTQLNTPGIELGGLSGVHAMTDVTGFGLLGHLLEMCRASHARASIDFARIPLLPDALGLAKRGLGHGPVESALGVGGTVHSDHNARHSFFLQIPAICHC